MKITIQESAIDNFNFIEKLSQNRNISLGSFVDIHTPISQIIDSFQTLSSKRPKLKKVGIYTLINLKNIYVNLSQQSCEQIVNRYIRGICWLDLQYIVFFDVIHHDVYIHIIFNRVTSEGKLIDLNCLGATWQQYEVLRQSCSPILEKPMSLLEGCRG